MMPRPVITPLADPAPAEILPLSLVKEFIGLDADLDADQDAVLPVLRRAAQDEGEQITGIVWGAAPYRVDGLRALSPAGTLRLPLCPVLSVSAVSCVADGAETALDAAAYVFTPALIELGRPWAEISPDTEWPAGAETFSVTCMAGWTAQTLPESIRAWMLSRIATLYDIRQDMMAGMQPAALPREHTRALLDRWTVRGGPYA